VTTEVVGYARQDDVSLYNGEQGTPGYGLVNAMFEWSPGNRLRLEARVDNLLDRAYQDHVAGVNRAGGSDVPVGVRLYGVEPTLAMGFAYSF
ncbi:MAG: TonB-dependent receptor, partial [Woeseiaceae bacterium]